MGGKAFPGRTGTRLTTPQLELLSAHCLSALVPLFPAGVTVGRYAAEKTSHGDLDLIVAYEGKFISRLRGGEAGTHESDPDDDTEIRAWVEASFKKAAEVASLQKKVEVQVDRGEVERWVAGGVKVRGLCVRVCRAIGAVAWTRNWPVSSYAVPCSVTGVEAEREGDYEPFFQVDVNVVHPDSIKWTKFMSSYSHTGHVLGQLLRLISKSLVPQHATCLLLRQSPYFGLSAIEISLTHDPEAFLAWLGPNYETWRRNHFNLQSDFWTWLVDVPEDSLLAHAIRKMVRRRVERRGASETGFKAFRGDPVFNLFADWVADHSRWAVLAKAKEEEIAAGEDGQGSPSKASAKDDPPFNPALVDPEQPNTLSPVAIAALEYWGKTEAYAAALERRKSEAVVLAEQQKVKLAAKAESERRMGLKQALEGQEKKEGEGRVLASMRPKPTAVASVCDQATMNTVNEKVSGQETELDKQIEGLAINV